jgi:hypothetical protein
MLVFSWFSIPLWEQKNEEADNVSSASIGVGQAERWYFAVGQGHISVEVSELQDRPLPCKVRLTAMQNLQSYDTTALQSQHLKLPLCKPMLVMPK